MADHAQVRSAAKVQAPPVSSGVGQSPGPERDLDQDMLGNAELQARMSGAGGGGGTTASGAEGGPGTDTAGAIPGISAFSKDVQAVLMKGSPEAQQEFLRFWPVYVAHVKARVAQGWTQGNLGNLELSMSKRAEVKMDKQELPFGLSYPFPRVSLRDPKEGDPMGVCYDWRDDIRSLIQGAGLQHWSSMSFVRSGVDHHAAGLHLKSDVTATIVLDGWADHVKPTDIQTEAEWLAD